MNKIHDTSFNWTEEIKHEIESYKFQPTLTKKLDNQHEEFTEKTFLEIVLWKTNRYPEINQDLLRDVNDLRKLYTEEKARAILKTMLSLRGFDLPMASTVLRFACPDHLQIIDQRVYRLITAGADSLKLPYNEEKKIAVYFAYIDELKLVCSKYGIPFNKSDRILYQLDKKLNRDFPIKY